VQLGELYRYTGSGDGTLDPTVFKHNRWCVYAGEDKLVLSTGIPITNHWFLVGGEMRLVSSGALTRFESTTTVEKTCFQV